PADPVEMRVGDRGFAPPLAVAMTGQRVLVRAADGRLHTAVARQDGEARFNVPLLRTGDPTALPFGKALGVLSLGCTAHRDEAPARLVVLSHPCSAWSDGEGRFTLRGVPSGRLHLAALRPDGKEAGADLDLAPGGAGDVRLAP